MSTRRLALSAVAVLAGVVLFPAAALATTITLSVDPATPTQGNWVAGNLIEIIILAASDGDATHGFAGADFKTGAFSLSSKDASRLRVHDPNAFVTIQVDTESNANLYGGIGGSGYVKAQDTWVYDEFTEFVGTVDMAAGSFQAVASPPLGSDEDLGTGSPIEFLHLVFQVQNGFDPGESVEVEFYGLVSAFNTMQGNTYSQTFGTAGSAYAKGSFDITILPEPCSLVLLLAGCAALAARRRRPNERRLQGLAKQAKNCGFFS